MKTLLLLSCAFLISSTILTGCTHKAYTVKYTVDYSKYINDGFWVSPMEFQSVGKCTPIATVTMEYGEEFGFNASDDIQPNTMLDMLVENAKTKGANGLISVRVHRDIRSDNRPVWQASGVAVKFENETPRSTFMKYDIERALRETKARGIPLISTAKKDGAMVYFDPDSNMYLYEDNFIKKYGLPALEQLKEQGKY